MRGFPTTNTGHRRHSARSLRGIVVAIAVVVGCSDSTVPTGQEYGNDYESDSLVSVAAPV